MVEESVSPEREVVQNIARVFEPWAEVDLMHVSILRMSGLSNYCVKVAIEDQTLKGQVIPNVLLYRRFECQIGDKKMEQIIFESMSK